jgi:hypothetical protein
MSLYVIRCSTNVPKYYIGISSNVNHRLELHFSGQSGVAWVNHHAKDGTWSLVEQIDPVVTPEGLKDLTPFAENILTKEYMSLHGIENVRGGRWSQIDLQEFVVNELNMEFRAAKDLCYVCGLPGHQSRNCQRGHSRMYTDSNSVIGASGIVSGSTDKSGQCGLSGTSLWCTLDGPYKDSINGNTVNYSGQRGGRTDFLIKKGAYFFFRETSADNWIPCGPILECVRDNSDQDKNVSKFILKLSNFRGAPVHGKKRAVESSGLRLPSKDKWEMSGIITH